MMLAIKQPPGIGVHSLYDAFKKWTLDWHTFDMVSLTKKELETLSSGARFVRVRQMQIRKKETRLVCMIIKLTFLPRPDAACSCFS